MLRRIGALFAVLALCLAGGLPARAQTSSAPAAATDTGGYEYKLGSGDKLRISVFGEDSLTGEFLVSGAGKISFPLIGDVDVQGLTIPEVQRAIEDKLKDGYLKQPKVSAEVENYRPFYILGEVMKPGEYPYGLGSIRAIDGLAMNSQNAQALTSLGAAHNVYLQWLLQMGFPGALYMFAAVGLVLLAIVRGLGRRSSQQALAIGCLGVAAVFAVHGLVDFALEEPSLAAFFSAMLGLGYGLAERPASGRRRSSRGPSPAQDRMPAQG